MQDRFLFRGKRVDNGEWVVGLLSLNLSEISHIRVKIGEAIESARVISNTVSQCTGLKDKNGRLIFEGDIARGQSAYEISEVVYRDGVYMMAQVLGHRPALWEQSNIEIIGNHWDNQELLA